ncbi:glycosyltransferase family 4 protein [Candidatus Peregrinibacteria bacterium]|nr:glycosyltransferase family 4 protein [Candidatus Peregrinibacteria bacterium]
MKIAIDVRAASGEKAGKGWYTFHLIRNLLLIDQKNQYLLYSREKIPGLDQFPNAEFKLISGRGLLWHLKAAYSIKKEKCDVFFAQASYIIPSILPKNIKTVIAVHDLVAFLFPNTHEKKAVFVEKIFLKRAIKKSTRICAVSENTRRDLIEFFHTDPAKITTVYCAADDGFQQVDQKKLTEFISRTNLPEIFFLAVGTIEPRKNYLNLIKAFKLVRERYPNCHLIIVGKPGWDYGEVYRQLAEFSFSGYVHVLGYLSGTSLVNLYNLARALVFPSFYEGFGMPPLEAMQCGCPVIASYSSSLPEVVGDGALLIDPENVNQIAGAMITVIKDPELCMKIQKKGLVQARKFSWKKSAEKLLEIFEIEAMQGSKTISDGAVLSSTARKK